MALLTLDGRTVATPESGRFWVAPGAAVIGSIVLAEDASVWFNAVLRGDNETITVGERSNVQDGAVLHTDPGFPLTIGAECTVGHLAMLHGCTIGRGSLIGIGAIVLNGTTIGEECLIGAGALVGEGKVIPPRSLVLGSPGRVVRQLTDDDVARIRRGVLAYVQNWQRYKAGLTSPG
jgi:carbonic anhydrase/acetyltransferase-like protein (isoleucine patch superfamily)